MADRSGRYSSIIDSVHSPLGFFVLALLIVEGFLTLVLSLGSLASNDKLTGIWLMAGLFTLVISFVFLLVWARPSHIIFDKNAHLISQGRLPLDAPEPIGGPKRSK